MPGTGPDQPAGAGEGNTPGVALEGFSGRLDHLLALARAGGVDLSRLSMPTLLDQLAAALARVAPLAHKADWLVMAAWLLHLRSAMLFPADAPARQAGEADAERLRARLTALGEARALAAWLGRRPQLGQDVFSPRHPEWPGLFAGPAHEVDIIEFLWCCLDLFDDDSDGADTPPVVWSQWRELHSVVDARARILARLAGSATPLPLVRLLPDPGDSAATETHPRRASAWTSTFAASLELARQGEVTLAQDGAFAPIQVGSAAAT